MACCTFSRSTFPNGKARQFYNQSITAVGTCTNFLITLVGGSLPPGINFSSSTNNPAVFSGRPTRNGTFTFTLNLSSDGECSQDMTFKITVKTRSNAKGYVPNPFDLFYGRINCPRGNYNDCANGACVEWSAQYGWSNAAFATCQNLCKNGCGGGGSSKTSGGGGTDGGQNDNVNNQISGQNDNIMGVRGMQIPSLKSGNVNGQSGQRVGNQSTGNR